jgi:hypothetical protein
MNPFIHGTKEEIKSKLVALLENRNEKNEEINQAIGFVQQFETGEKQIFLGNLVKRENDQLQLLEPGKLKKPANIEPTESNASNIKVYFKDPEQDVFWLKDRAMAFRAVKKDQISGRIANSTEPSLKSSMAKADIMQSLMDYFDGQIGTESLVSTLGRYSVKQKARVSLTSVLTSKRHQRNPDKVLNRRSKFFVECMNDIKNRVNNMKQQANETTGLRQDFRSNGLFTASVPLPTTIQ